MNDEQRPAALVVHRSSFIVHRLISSLWFGAGVFLLAIAAPAAFRAASTATEAANVVGAMLNGWHYLALLAPLILIALQWRRPRGWVVALLFAAIVVASAQAMIDMRIRGLRMHSSVPIGSLSREDPLRRRFGLFHGLSSLLLLVQIAGAGVVTCVSDPATET
jgi:hypothetical protein